MWNALQGATANIANRATRLAADVLETASEEFSANGTVGPQGQRLEHQRTGSIDSQASGGNSRLAALKARYKANGSGPTSLPEHAGWEHGRSHSPGFTVSTPKHDREAFTYHESSSGSHDMALSALNDNSEVIKLRDQLDRLKGELLQQSIGHEEEGRLREFDFKEQVKSLNAAHRKEVERIRAESDGAVTSGKQLEEQNAEIQRLKQELQNVQQRELDLAFGEASADVDPGVNAVLASVRYQLEERGLTDLSAQSMDELLDSIEDLISSKEEEVEKMEVQLDAFREGGDAEQDGQKLAEENTVLRTEIEALRETMRVGGSGSGEETNAIVQELQKKVDELHEECNRLRAGEKLSEGLTDVSEKEALWSNKLEAEVQAHRETQQKLQSLEGELNIAKANVSEAVGARRELEELQTSIEDRDRIWQQELVKGQEEVQKSKLEVESLKVSLQEALDSADVNMAGAKAECSSLSHELRKIQGELKNEQELRHGAEAHVKSMQKSLEYQFANMDASASSTKSELQKLQAAFFDAQNDLRVAKESLAAEIQSSRAAQEALVVAENRLRDVEDSNSSKEAEWKQEIERLQVLNMSMPEVDDTHGAGDSSEIESRWMETQAENQMLKAELDDLRIKAASAEEKLQLALQQQKESDSEADVVQIMQTRATELELEKNRLKEQLNRLKRQMLSMQEDQEASIGWRIDAEVKLAVEEALRKEAETGGHLNEKIEALETSVAKYEADCKSMEKLIEQKDVEIINLQSALGELTFHSEAAEKLRKEMRVAKEQIDDLKDQLGHARSEVAEAQSARRAAEATADRANKSLTLAKEHESGLETEAVNLKRALLETSNRVTSLNEDAGSMVDRRLVVKLLVTYLERRNNREVLALMAKMLHFTDEEKARVGLDGHGRRGIVGALAGGTMALVRGGVSVATLGMIGGSGQNVKPGESLADRWVEFLLKEAEVDGADRRDFRQDPMTLLKEENPFGKETAVVEQISPSPRKVLKEDDSAMEPTITTRQPLPPSPLKSGPLSAPTWTTPSPSYTQFPGRTNSPIQNGSHHIQSYGVGQSAFGMQSYGIHAANGVPLGVVQNHQAGVQPRFPNEKQSFTPSPPPVSNPGAMGGSSVGGSMSSLSDYMAKYHSNK
ncbi:hypothetical protein BSKO_00021 [Bryopsis sp. KO-2023]|nr:hypothetical protein BSKO_00021 [Bryopsis sp. KO-2023]